jgi:hypothetical protein
MHRVLRWRQDLLKTEDGIKPAVLNKQKYMIKHISFRYAPAPTSETSDFRGKFDREVHDL